MRHQSYPKASGQRVTVVSLSVWSCAACHFRGGGSQSAAECYGARDLKSAILKRVAVEKQRREMDVYYYRIGYTTGFPLPLTQRPSLKELPTALPGRAYPWLIWLSWDLAFSAGRAGFGSPTRAISNTGPATSATTRWEFRRTTRR